jgi:hypothetical protein
MMGVPLNNNQAIFSTSFSAIGSLQIKARYDGDANNLGSTSPSIAEKVKSPMGTTTRVTTSGSPSFINNMVTFTATTTSAQGSIPDGEVITFSDGSIPMGTGLTVNGLTTLSTSSLAAKTHTIHASYPGDFTHKPSLGAVQQLVTLYPSSAALNSNPNPSIYGQQVGLTAIVSSSAPNGPSGTVTFKNGASTLGTVTLTGGIASLSTSKLPAGTLTLTATYNGDTQSAKSSSTASQTVNPVTSIITLNSSLNPSLSGQLVKFTAIATSQTITPVGSVTWMDGNTVLGSTNLSGGRTSYSTTTLGTGLHSITAVYNGTANIAGSTSPLLLQNVN